MIRLNLFDEHKKHPILRYCEVFIAIRFVILSSQTHPTERFISPQISGLHQNKCGHRWRRRILPIYSILMRSHVKSCIQLYTTRVQGWCSGGTQV